MISFNGSTVASIGWFVEKTSGLEDQPSRELLTATLPGRETSIVTSSRRPVSVSEGVVTVGARATTESALQTKIAALNALLFTSSAVTVTSTRRPSQQRTGHVVGAPADYRAGPEFVGPFDFQYGIRLRFPDLWEDSSEQTVAFTTATAIPQGTADSRGVITITASGGSAVDPVITYKKGDGTTVSTLSPTITIVSGDAWQIDCGTGQVRKRVSAVWSNASETLPDVFTIPVFRRAHFTYGTNSPTLAVVGTNAAGSVTYRRRYA
jgi:hypothetical protein